MRLAGKIWMVLACALLLVACGSDSEAPVADATPPEATSTSEPESEMSVGNIIWTESTDVDTGAPLDEVTQFTPESPAIIAVIEVEDVPANTEFNATWIINDQPIEGTDMQIITDSDMPHAWIEFRFNRNEDQRYPTGLLGVIITTSEGELREATIEIGFP